MSAILSSERIDRAALERAIARTLGILHPSGETWEIRAPKMGLRGTISGYYNEAARCARDVAPHLDAKAPGVYVTINPVKRELLGRAFNRLQERAETATADAEIVRRRWLPLDFDPQRPAGISATDTEHDAALTRAEEMVGYLTGRGWPAPVRADSGNGAHLLYHIDLPNDPEGTARQLVERVLKGLAAFCDDARDADPCIRLDTTLGNAARILKLYPTMVRKGDAMPDRPHRRSGLLDVPEQAEIVTRAQLEELANELCPPSATAKVRPDAQSTHGQGWIDDLGRYLSDHGITVASERDAANARKFLLEACVWNPAHTDHSAWLMQFSGNGAIAAGCSHNSCQGKRWPDFRDAVEPGWRATPHADPDAEANARNARNAENGTGTKGNSAFLAFSEYPPAAFPEPDQAMYYGTAGDIIGGIAPHTEASPVALLVQLLVCVGNAAGRHVYYLAEADRHYPNLYAVMVGDTAKARKGTSWGHIARVFREADPGWETQHIVGGLSSGEGIIHALRNVADADLPAGDAGELLRDK